MSRPKKNPLSFEDMQGYQLDKMQEQRDVPKGVTPYRGFSERSREGVSDLVGQYLTEFANFNGKINLEDVATVKAYMVMYLESCRSTGTFPTNMGLARALGYTQRSLNAWRKEKPQTETAFLLEAFADMCSDVVAQSALKNYADKVFSIFMCKAQYGWRDNDDIMIPEIQDNSLSFSVEDIKARYLRVNNRESNPLDSN